MGAGAGTRARDLRGRGPTGARSRQAKGRCRPQQRLRARHLPRLVERDRRTSHHELLHRVPVGDRLRAVRFAPLAYQRRPQVGVGPFAAEMPDLDRGGPRFWPWQQQELDVAAGLHQTLVASASASASASVPAPLARFRSFATGALMRLALTHRGRVRFVGTELGTTPRSPGGRDEDHRSYARSMTARAPRGGIAADHIRHVGRELPWATNG